MPKIFKVILLFSLLISKSLWAESKGDDARMLINLMDYIAKDYVMAVQNGTVINDFEYAEMGEFISTASDYANKLGLNEKSPEILAGVAQLEGLISDTADYQAVSSQARSIKIQLLALNLVSSYPKKTPSLKNGASAFQVHCASCHGTNGSGDGPAGIALNPKPTNFTDSEIMSGVAPFQAFNTIRLGIPGTGMRAFSELDEDQIWDLAFYIASIQHKENVDSEPQLSLSLEELSTLSDDQLISKYPTVNLGAQRNHLVSDNSTNIEDRSPLIIARNLLDKTVKAYQNKDYEAASTHALNAYLQGVEPIEPQIMASDNALFMELETSMMNLRSKIKSHVPTDEFNSEIERAHTALNQAEELLNAGERGMVMTTFIAASILIREGLEAFFIILVILGILKSVNAPTAVRWVHGGWLTAVAFGVIGWFFADSLMNMSAASREFMEGVIALFAVVVLLYLGFWMHGKTEASKWKAFVEERIGKLVSTNNMFGLGVFSFVVVFREAFESVLFLSSLTADGSSNSKIGVFLGFIVSALIISLIGWAMLKWFKRLPISKVFLYSSMIILALAFVLTGQGIHAIQEGGYIGIHSFPVNIRISTLGIYPTYESLITQGAILGLIIYLWKMSSSKRVRPSA